MYDTLSSLNSVKHISEELRIPQKLCQPISSDRSLCLVNDDWLKNIHKGQIFSLSCTDTIDNCSAERYLSRSCDKIPPPWVRVTIKTIAKSDEICESLPGHCLQKQWACSSLYEFMSHITKENMTNLWIQAHSTLVDGFTHYSAKRDCLPFTDLVRQLLRRLNPLVYFNLQTPTELNASTASVASSSSADTFCTGSSSRPGSFYNVSDAPLCYGIVPVDAVIETDNVFFVVQPYYPFTLQDVISFSPIVLDTSHAKPLFILYQLLHVIQSLHNHGLRLGDIRLCDIVMDKNLWLRITCPRISNLKKSSSVHSSPGSVTESLYVTANSPDSSKKPDILTMFQESLFLSNQQGISNPANHEKVFQTASDFMKAQQYQNYEVTMLDSIVDAWVHRHFNNFQYLMILNHLAGRRMGDPNNHPVLPWVLDFSAPDSGYRDLTKSKFRLNKGDGQLDFTYSGMAEASETSDHVPHHVSDVLSDITYYVYKARRTPKSILCTYVRSKWVPHEYPLSMQRLQDWTPDECIPEFFIDPTIFESIHEDLPDLEIPLWSKNAMDFVIKHLAALESDHVSNNLHHWIDLTFGYKLSGSAAVKAKNVHLRMVDHHTYLTPHGAKQLFSQPHPQREPLKLTASSTLPQITRGLLNSQLLSYGFSDLREAQGFENSDISEAGRINQATIYLPRNYNPIADLEKCETLQDFKAKALHVIDTHPQTTQPQLPPKYQDDGVTEDMVTLLCLICEIFLDPKLRMQDTQVPLWKRFKTLKKIVSPDFSEIQRPLQKFVSDIFESLKVTSDKKFIFHAILPDGSPPPTPSFLIQPYSDVIPFPAYFSELYTCLSQIEGKQLEIDQLKTSWISFNEKMNKIKQLEREKVPILDSFLWRHQGYLGSEGMGLILPYIQDLLQNEFSTVHAAWSLLNVATQELGPEVSTKQFIPSLTALYSGDVLTPKHIKLYHRSFLVQLIIRLGLKTFLTNFATVLVEAVAGYKDFTITNRFYSEELAEALTQDDLFEIKRESNNWSREEFKPKKVLDFVDASTKEESSEEIGEKNIEAVNDENHALMQEENLKDLLGDDEYSEHLSLEIENNEYRLEENVQNMSDSRHKSEDQHSIHSISNIIPLREDLQNFPDDTKLPEDDDLVFDVDSVNETQDSVLRENISTHNLDISNAGNIKTKTKNVLEISKMQIEPTDISEAHSVHTVESPESHIPPDSNKSSKKLTFQDTVGLKCEQQRKSLQEECPKLVKSNECVDVDKVDAAGPERVRSTSDMVRSETEDLMHHLTSDGSDQVINIRDIAADSVKWLCHKVGPVLATKYLSRNLVRMLALCYLGQEQLEFVDEKHTNKTSRLIAGDLNAQKVLECIGFTVMLYGEQVILIQCLPNIMDMIALAQKRLSPRTEAGIIASVILLSFLIPYLSDTCLMDILEENILGSCISPIVSIITSPTIYFPCGAPARLVLCHKLLDLLYILGLRLGFDLTRRFLSRSMVTLFDTFSYVYGQSVTTIDTHSTDSSSEAASYGSDETYLNIKMDQSTQQYEIGSPVDPRRLKSSPRKTSPKMHSLSSIGLIDDKEDFVDPMKSPSGTTEKSSQELKAVFCPELAQACYIPLCRIFGSIHMEEKLKNEDLIRQLCAQHDSFSDAISKPNEETKAVPTSQSYEEDVMTPTDDNGLGSNVALVGNRINLTNTSISSPIQSEIGQFGRGYKHSGILSIHYEDIRLIEMETNKSRHLKGNWLAYCERELGLHERDTMFNFLQIELQTYIGHSGSIRSILAMDTENSFISASKDKTVRLWSINSCGDGMKKQTSQFCYSRHKKSVFSVTYVESLRLVVSCDSTVHIWDPYTGVLVKQLESPSNPPIVALTALPAPSTLVVTATTDATLRFLDMRASKYAHDFHCSVGNTGLIRCLVVSPDCSWLAVGFSSGIIYIIDINSGILLQYWKAHDSEILQLKAFSKTRLFSSACDQTIKLWNVNTGEEVCPSKNQSEPAHCMCIYRDQLVSATTSNKVSVYVNITDSSPTSTLKLRSTAFKGVLTYMALLPLNKALLLGSDNGIIRLMA